MNLTTEQSKAKIFLENKIFNDLGATVEIPDTFEFNHTVKIPTKDIGVMSMLIQNIHCEVIVWSNEERTAFKMRYKFRYEFHNGGTNGNDRDYKIKINSLGYIEQV